MLTLDVSQSAQSISSVVRTRCVVDLNAGMVVLKGNSVGPMRSAKQPSILPDVIVSVHLNLMFVNSCAETN